MACKTPGKKEGSVNLRQYRREEGNTLPSCVEETGCKELGREQQMIENKAGSQGCGAGFCLSGSGIPQQDGAWEKEGIDCRENYKDND